MVVDHHKTWMTLLFLMTPLAIFGLWFVGRSWSLKPVPIVYCDVIVGATLFALMLLPVVRRDTGWRIALGPLCVVVITLVMFNAGSADAKYAKPSGVEFNCLTQSHPVYVQTDRVLYWPNLVCDSLSTGQVMSEAIWPNPDEASTTALGYYFRYAAGLGSIVALVAVPAVSGLLCRRMKSIMSRGLT